MQAVGMLAAAGKKTKKRAERRKSRTSQRIPHSARGEWVQITYNNSSLSTYMRMTFLEYC